MSNYVPRYSKKRERCERLQADLIRLLAAGAATDEVERIAEEVRRARLRALKARRAQLPPNHTHQSELREIDRLVREWEAMSVESIVRHCRHAPEASNRLEQSAEPRAARAADGTDVGPSMVDHQVFFVLQDHDGDLWSLSRTGHVWLAHSPANDEAARRVWDREPGDYSPLRGVSMFPSSSDRVADFYAFLATIDEHHGTDATPTAWAAIHVRGVAIEQIAPARIATELGDVPFRILPEPGGFAIIRTAPQA